MEVNENTENKDSVNQKVKPDTKERIEDWIAVERKRTGKKPTGDAILRRALDLLDQAESDHGVLKSSNTVKIVNLGQPKDSNIPVSPEALRWAELADVARTVKRASGPSTYLALFTALRGLAEDALAEQGHAEKARHLPRSPESQRNTPPARRTGKA